MVAVCAIHTCLSDVYVSYFFLNNFFLSFCNVLFFKHLFIGTANNREAGMNANKSIEPKIISTKKKWLNPSHCMYKWFLLDIFLRDVLFLLRLGELLRKLSERSVLNSIVCCWWWWWKKSLVLVCGGTNIYIKFCWKYAVDSLSVFVFQSLSESEIFLLFSTNTRKKATNKKKISFLL